MGNFTFVDVVVAVVLLGSAGFAFLRGFVHEVLSILAWVGAGFAALYGFHTVQPFFRQHIGAAWAADAAAGASLFLVSLLVLSIATKAVANRVRNSALNSVDSSLGFVFGLVRGAVLLCLAYMVVAWLFKPDQQPDWIAQARTKPWLERGATLLKGLAPSSFGAAEETTRAASGEAREVIEAERTFRKFVAPQPAQPDGAGSGGKPPAQGYDKDSRGQMDRLFQTNQ
ncbi:MAG: CvpA family protein [Solirubrobacterales bacterium]